VAATGRFRTLQVEIIRLYGYEMNLLAYYLAIWRYLKYIRRQIERGQSLYAPGEQPGSEDAFYNLFDMFRFEVSVARFVYRAPKAAKPPSSVVAGMRCQGDLLFDRYLGAAEQRDPDPGIPEQSRHEVGVVS
jgi:hypothetical protein